MVEVTLSERGIRNFISVCEHQMRPFVAQLRTAIDRFGGESTELPLVRNETDLVLGTYYGLSNALQQAGMRDEPATRRYALYCGTRATLERLGTARSIPQDAVDQTVSVDFRRDFYVARDVIATLIKGLQSNTLESLVHRFSKGLFDLNDSAYRQLHTQAQQHPSVSVLNVTIKDTERLLDRLQPRKRVASRVPRGARKQPEPSYEHSVSVLDDITDNFEYTFDEADFDDIVGNDVLKKSLRQSMEDLLAYDKQHKINPVLYEHDGTKWAKREVSNFIQRYLLFGRGGTGKTLSARAAFTYARKLSDEHNISIRFVDPTNLFNSYVHGSSGKLKDFFAMVDAGDTRYGIFVDEIDTHLTRRGCDGGGGVGEIDSREILGTFMRWLGGNSKNLGNYVFIATTNDPKGLDPYFLERFQKGTHHVQGPTTAPEYIKILRDLKLPRSIQKGLVHISDWHSIGRKLEQHHATGRDVDDIYTRLARVVDVRARPGNFYDLGLLGQAQAISSSLTRRIADQEFHREIDQHFSTKRNVGGYQMP